MADITLSQVRLPTHDMAVETKATVRAIPWAEMIMVVLAVRIALSLIGAVALLLPKNHGSLTLAELLLAPWRRFDAEHFTQIAAHGYAGSSLNAAYLPLYPLLIRLGALLTFGHYLSAALLVSLISSVIGVGLFWQWAAERFDRRIAWRAVVVLLLFPDGFFLLGAYSESLFLVLSAGCLLATRRERPLLAGVLAALATLTRLQGLVLLVPMGVQAWRTRERTGNRWHWVGRDRTGHSSRTREQVGKTLRWVPAIAAAPLVLEVYQRLVLPKLGGGNDLMKVFQQRWHITLQAPWQTIGQYISVIRSPRFSMFHSSTANYVMVWDLGIGIAVLVTLVVSARRLGSELTLYGVAAWCFALSRWYSTGRYMLAVLPVFLAVALWADGRSFRWLTTLSLCLQIFFAIEFAQGSWID